MDKLHKPSSITLFRYHLSYLKQDHHKDIFIKGLDEIFEGKIPDDTGYSDLNEVLLKIANNVIEPPPKTVQNIPPYDLEGLTPAEEYKFKKVSNGWIPVNLRQDCSYKGLKFKNITTFDLDTLKQLKSTINNYLATQDRRRTKVVWLEYVLEVMAHSVNSGQLDILI